MPVKQKFTIALCLVVAALQATTAAAKPKPGNLPEKTGAVPGEYIVKFRSATNAEQAREFSARIGGKVKRKLLAPRTWLLKLDKNKEDSKFIQRLKARPNVAYVEPNSYVSAFFVPNDRLYGRQWNFRQLHTNLAWNRRRGRGVVVAVVDTGIAYENYSDGRYNYRLIPDLRRTRFVSGYNFVNNTTHANDDNQHGTHVAGTIAQSTNNRKGVAGIAFEASIMPVKVLNSGGYGTIADVSNGIRWAADHGAHIINLSLGTSSPSETLRKAVNYARYKKNVVVVAAAGNNGNARLSYPAAYRSVISVAATNLNKTLAWYSQYGSGLDISAPGGDTNADADHNGRRDGILQQTIYPNNPVRAHYAYFQGTSMASPHVAAVAALIRSRPGFNKASTVTRTIKHSATDLGAPGFDTRYGWGLVNALNAVRWRRVVKSRITNPTGNSVLTGGRRIRITWNRKHSKRARFQLAYSSNAYAGGTYNNNFESGSISKSLVQGGNAKWVATSAASAGGTYSAKSGDIDDNQTSELSLKRILNSASAISFKYQISSEPAYDYLDFYIDGSRKLHVSGYSGWTNASFSVASGEHTFKWIYEKDNSVSSGRDAAYIDDISLPNVNTAKWHRIVKKTARGARSYRWRVPLATGNNYRLRIRGHNGIYGKWSYGSRFSVR